MFPTANSNSRGPEAPLHADSELFRWRHGQAGTDYTSLAGSVTFAEGSSTADVTVAATDNPIEGPETVSVTVATGSGYSGGSPSIATLNIIALEADTTSVGTLENAAVTFQPPAPSPESPIMP